MACNSETGENFRIHHYEMENIILKVQLFSSEKIKIKELTQVRWERTDIDKVGKCGESVSSTERLQG